MESYLEYVKAFQDLLKSGETLPLGPVGVSAVERRNDAGRVLLFSPHPDDEILMGGLALRMNRELGLGVTAVAVTLGSRKERREERWDELKDACGVLGFDYIRLGMEGLAAEDLKKNPRRLDESAERIAEVLRREQPEIIFVPHGRDAHAVHQGVHLAVRKALELQDASFQCQVFETEFWSTLDTANVLVELKTEDVADLLKALACHTGEVRRNPYHLTLPAWLIDNARRGSELVSGAGTDAHGYNFAVVCRWRVWAEGEMREMNGAGGKTFPASVPLSRFWKTDGKGESE